MIRAVLFDLDGTLIDSERQTDQAILEVMATHGVEGARLPPQETRGRSWPDVVRFLQARYAITVAPKRIEEALIQRWMTLTEKVEPLPGAVDAVRALAKLFSLAVVSSSPRHAIDALLEQIGVGGLIPPGCRLSADEITNPKPHPEGFLTMAARLGVEPEECLVFEDSSAGLRAARTAGMFGVALLHVCAEPDLCRSLADAAIQHYAAVPAEVWSKIGKTDRTSLAGLFRDAAKPA